MKLKDTNEYKNLAWKLTSFANTLSNNIFGLNLTRRNKISMVDYDQNNNLNSFSQIFYYWDLLDDLKKIEDLEDEPEAMEKLQEIETARVNVHEELRDDLTTKAFQKFTGDYDAHLKKLGDEELKEVYAEYHKYSRPDAEMRKKEEARDDLKTVGTFTGILDTLKRVKTRKNSEEYEKIIKAVEFANSNEVIPKGKDLTQAQAYAVKLLVIKNRINEYIEHKAKDGVRTSAYQKLAVVEALNKSISDKLSRLTLDKFTINDKPVNLRKLPISLEDERKAVKAAKPDANLPKANPLSNADGCMCRIITKAIEKNCSDGQIKKLVKMRSEYQSITEAQYAKEAKEAERANANEQAGNEGPVM